MEMHKQMSEWLTQRKEACEKRRAALIEDDRRDEANFQKITENIYDIFCAVLSAAEKSCKGDIASMQRFFEDRLIQLPKSWQEALKKAEQQGEDNKQYIEQLKLNTVKEISEKYQSLK